MLIEGVLVRDRATDVGRPRQRAGWIEPWTVRPGGIDRRVARTNATSFTKFPRFVMHRRRSSTAPVPDTLWSAGVWLPSAAANGIERQIANWTQFDIAETARRTQAEGPTE